MRIALSAACSVVAAATGTSLHHVKGLARRLQELDEFPRSPGGRLPALVNYPQIVRLLLALLIDKPALEAARLGANMSDYRSDNVPVGDYVARMLQAAGGVDFRAPASVLTFNASLTVHTGVTDAVVIRYGCSDEPLEEVFTRSGVAWKPEHGETITSARTIPGILLHRIGRGLAEVRDVAV